MVCNCRQSQPDPCCGKQAYGFHLTLWVADWGPLFAYFRSADLGQDRGAYSYILCGVRLHPKVCGIMRMKIGKLLMKEVATKVKTRK